MNKSFFVLIFVIASFSANSQPLWIQKHDSPSERAEGVGFTIGSKAYIGTGSNNGTLLDDFWEYNPAADTLGGSPWTQKADFEGGARYGAVGFSIGTKGYIGTGWNGNTLVDDFWEYDPENDSWTQKSNFGGVARQSAAGLSIGGKGYIGTGWDGSNYTSDFWEYDTSSNIWTKKVDFPGGIRSEAVSFSIGSIGYIGLGQSAPNEYQVDFYAFNQGNDSWSIKQTYPGTKSAATGFTINNSLGYVISGVDFWEYNPIQNWWYSKPEFPGVSRKELISFSVDKMGFICGGNDGNNFLKDFWLYGDTSTALGAPINLLDNLIQVYPIPSINEITLKYPNITKNISIEICDLKGKSLLTKTIKEVKSKIDISDFSSGMYIIKINCGSQIVIKKFIKE